MLDHFAPLMQDQGRVVNVSSGGGPMWVKSVESDEERDFLCQDGHSWPTIEKYMLDNQVRAKEKDSLYRFSKACLNLLTMEQARAYPNLMINGVSPGFIDTNMTSKM